MYFSSSSLLFSVNESRTHNLNVVTLMDFVFHLPFHRLQPIRIMCTICYSLSLYLSQTINLALFLVLVCSVDPCYCPLFVNKLFLCVSTLCFLSIHQCNFRLFSIQSICISSASFLLPVKFVPAFCPLNFSDCSVPFLSISIKCGDAFGKYGFVWDVCLFV